MDLAKPFRSNAFKAALLTSLFVINVVVTVQLRRQSGGVDSLWTANAFCIAALVLLPWRWSWACVGAGCLLQTVWLLLLGRPLTYSAAFGLSNMIEASLVAWLVCRTGVERLTTPGRVARLIFLAVLPGLILSTAFTAVLSNIVQGGSIVEMFMRRFPAKFLGIGMVLTAILMLARRGAMPMPKGRWLEAGAWTITIATLTLGLFSHIHFLPMFLMFPAVTSLGFRMGPRAVTLAVIAAAMVIFPVSILSAPGVMFPKTWPLGAQIFVTQVYIATLFFTGLIAALGARHQQRLRALFANKSKSALRARDRAKAASLAKTEFLATMSHEIRTPLNSILGFAQVLDRRGDLPEDARRQIGLIERSGGALLTVVNDILDFSKVEAGRIDLDPKPVDLTAACRDALSIVGENAEAKGLALSMTVEGAGHCAHICDDHRLRQVLLNFLNNAVKFTDVGGVRLELVITAGNERDHVRINVVDTGVGIAPEAAHRLFQRFSQVDSSISRSHGGTGLGLAICKGLVELMGGRVGVDSRPGEGSTFWLELTLERAEAVTQAGEADGEAEGLSAHILLVDDHPMNRELGTTVLTLLGCTADVACDGLEAIEAARTCRYDAILMDVHMPGLDGLAATRAIRALDGPAALTPIIAMSADVLPEQQEKMRAAGMVDSVGKPINIVLLNDCLSRWVGRDASGAPLSKAA